MWVSALYYKIYLTFLLFIHNFLLFFSWFFYFLLLLLFSLNSYLFCGDITHGRGSYLLIMHSSLAVFCNILLYLFILIFIIACIYFYYISLYSYYFYFIYYLLYVISLFSFYYYILFLWTGIIWGDYAWGFPVSIEYRFIVILLHIIFFFISALLLFFRIHFFFSSIFILSCLLTFIFLQFIDWLSNFAIKEWFTFISNAISRVEMHQSDESLHFFLLSISGYYISLIFIYIIYLLFALIFITITSTLLFVYVFDIYFVQWYLNNLYKNRSSFFIYYILL